MAVLQYTPVNVHPEATMQYILNPEKMLPGGSEDIHRVMNYMGDENSVERIYAFGHNCSANPELCEQQFALYRQRYYDYKNGAGVQGCNDDNSEILALHFFLSYDKGDQVTPEIMNDITARLCSETKIKDFPALIANHFNTDHKHSHLLLGQYSVNGKPHKFAMKQKDFDDLRRHANRLCYEYGLSIIDLPKLRLDKEYSDWLDGVIREGKVRVLDANGAGLKHRDERKGSYYRWLEAQKKFNAEEEKQLTERQLNQKRINSKYYFEVNGKVFRAAGKGDYYAVMRKENGRPRSTLELLCILVYVVCKGELAFAEEIVGDELEFIKDNPAASFYARRDYKLEQMVQAIATAREQQIDTPAAVGDRVKDTGRQMNVLKTEKKKHDTRISTGDALFDAITAYNHFKAEVEGVAEPNEVSKEIYNTAYSIMAAHKCTTPEQIDEFLTRRAFSVKKSEEYAARLDELKKQYRDLKRLEAVCNNPMQYMRKAYTISAKAKERDTLANRIKNAEGRKKKNTRPGDIIEREVIR